MTEAVALLQKKRIRWQIRCRFTTVSPMHIGDGDVVASDHPALQHEDRAGQVVSNDIQSVVRDHQLRPCIPGSAIKGVLRGWAELMLRGDDDRHRIERIFGKRDSGGKRSTAEAGWAEFCTAVVCVPETQVISATFRRFVPFWFEDLQEDSSGRSQSRTCFTGILSHVSIDRKMGTASHNKLYFEEYVPEGISFDVEINATRLSQSDIEFLVSIMEAGSEHSTHPWQLGANGANGWGRIRCSQLRVLKCPEQLNLSDPPVGFGCCTEPVTTAACELTVEPPPHIALGFSLSCHGAFLVNDASRAKRDDMSDDEKYKHTNFTALRKADGSVWFPASSFRGVLRSHVEYILRSLNPDIDSDPNTPTADGPVQRLFGTTAQRASILLTEPSEKGQSATKLQDFVAIDRFTGGAADGAKFDATYSETPGFYGLMIVNLSHVQESDIVLLARALQDKLAGAKNAGWGSSKGYGQFSIVIDRLIHWPRLNYWKVPSSLFVGEPTLDESEFATQNLQVFLRDAALLKSQPVQTGVGTKPQGGGLSGTLTVKKTKAGRWEYQLFWSNAGNGEKTVKLHEDQIRQELRGTEQIRCNVVFDIENGRQVCVRKPGSARHLIEAPPINDVDIQTRFAHPYYFLLSKSDRKSLPGPMQDSRPVGHERILPNLYSGVISVCMRAVTPLIICDRPSNPKETHKIYPMRKMPDGRPSIAASSIRGMLRAAFEAITNSRFGVFPGTAATNKKPAVRHGRRLGMRVQADDAKASVPVRVVEAPESSTGLAVELLKGIETVTAPDGTSVSPLAAAWVGRYPKEHPENRANVRFEHRREMWAYLTLWHYEDERRNTSFFFWNVEEVQPIDSTPTHIPTRRSCITRKATAVAWSTGGWYKGYMCCTGRNIEGKHDERFFFSDGKRNEIPIEDLNLQQWRELIQNYQDQHERELAQGLTGPRNGIDFSRHIMDSNKRVAVHEQMLRSGDLCYAEVDSNAGTLSIRSLYPVTISRRLYEKSPLELLPPALRPAKQFSELSPADRVFGWVSQDETAKGEAAAAYRSHVAIRNVECLTAADQSVDRTEITLRILSQPKPQQGRFYLCKSDGGRLDADCSKVAAGYTGKNRIRGPKVFPHHKVWAKPRSVERGTQNRTISESVAKETQFRFEVQISNLSEFDLGALLWLLDLPAEHHHRIGLGKPLGFGSVHLSVDETNTTLAKGEDWIRAYSEWGRIPQNLTAEHWKDLAERSAQMIAEGNVALIHGFLRCSKGFEGIPIGYPAVRNQSAGENFRWFIANERNDHRNSLPFLTDSDVTLPILNQGERRGNGR